MKYFFLFCPALFISTLCTSQDGTVGKKITGDFNADGKIDTAFLKAKTHQNTKIQSWTLFFSDKAIPIMQLGCCNPILVGENDLDGDKLAELSVFKAPENGCVYEWTTYSLKKNRWKRFIEPFLVSTNCEFKSSDLQSKVFKENGKVYYWDVDPNDEESKPIKKQVHFK